MPDERFFNHWATVHADLTVASEGFNVYQIQRYTQVSNPLTMLELPLTIVIPPQQHHQTKADKEAIQKFGFKALDFDGCSTLWCRSYEDFANLMESTPTHAHFRKKQRYFYPSGLYQPLPRSWLVLGPRLVVISTSSVGTVRVQRGLAGIHTPSPHPFPQGHHWQSKVT